MQQYQWNGRKRRRRRFGRLRRPLLIVLALVLTGLLIFGMVNTFHYVSQEKAAQTSNLLRRAMDVENMDALRREVDNEGLNDADGSEWAEISPVMAADTPRALASTAQTNALTALREKNPDVIGWLSIDSLLDEPVVQRDNVFYMDHDALGNANINGAVFLDAITPIEDEPDTLVLYGHNMRSGARFGSLWRYAQPDFYQSHPLITFEETKQKKTYVIFSTGILSTSRSAENYIDYLKLFSSNSAEREEAINGLVDHSLYACPFGAAADDQLLMLITCADQDDERRYLAARSLRENENETEIQY